VMKYQYALRRMRARSKLDPTGSVLRNNIAQFSLRMFCTSLL
jgi:hypothetical protein